MSAAGRLRSLGELKFIGHSKTIFPSDKKEGDRCSGVGKRAGTVNSDYLRNGRRADMSTTVTTATALWTAPSRLGSRSTGG